MISVSCLSAMHRLFGPQGSPRSSRRTAEKGHEGAAPLGMPGVGQGEFVSFLRPQGVFVSFAERLFLGSSGNPGEAEPPTAENAESAEARRPPLPGPAEGGFRRRRKSSRGATAAPPKRRSSGAPGWSPCALPNEPTTPPIGVHQPLSVFIGVPFFPRILLRSLCSMR